MGASSTDNDGLTGRLSVSRLSRSTRDAWYRSGAYQSVLRREVRTEFRRPIPLRSGDCDPEVGAIVLDGRLPHAGRMLPFGTLPWTVPPPGARAAEVMHGFTWLGGLRALGTAEAQARAQDLLRGWIRANPRWSAVAWQPATLGRRVVAWIGSADFVIGDGADESLRTAFFRSLSMQARHLVRAAAHESGTDAAFAAVRGRIAAALALEIGDIDGALDLLEREIERQILADGCHIQRNPTIHLMVLRDLLDMRVMLADADAEVPLMLTDAIERMVAILRFFRYGDGGLALFHGGKEGVVHEIDATLADAGVKERPPASAPAGAFERLAAGPVMILVDAGGPPPAGADRLAHAAPGAFELSVGRERLIVNCGGFAGDDRGWQEAMRSTAAHSASMIDNVNAVVVDAGGGLRSRKLTVGATRRDADGASWLEVEHDGYAARYSAHTRRRLYVDALGEDVRGEDTFEGRGGERCVVRFHLHPQVTAAIEADGPDGVDGIRLTLPSGAIYRLISVGGTPAIEDSVYLGRSDIAEPTRQIVIRTGFVENIARVKWALRRVDQDLRADDSAADRAEAPVATAAAEEPSSGEATTETEVQRALDLRTKPAPTSAPASAPMSKPAPPPTTAPSMPPPRDEPGA